MLFNNRSPESVPVYKVGKDCLLAWDFMDKHELIGLSRIHPTKRNDKKAIFTFPNNTDCYSKKL